jgi:hypothetical protein
MAAMMSLNSFRNRILQDKLAIGLFSLLFLGIALSAGFVHNHSADPFHTQAHDNCPVTVWSHTPFAFFGVSFQLVFSVLLVAIFFQILSSAPPQQCFSSQAPRAPPAFSS